jgi:hypothetical protein
MPTILLKKSDTASAVPTTANLTNLAGGAEVAVNTADKRLFTMNSSSAVVELGTNPTTLTTSSLTVTGGATLATSSGNVGIGGTAIALAKVHVLGTLPTSSNASQGFRMTGEIPSGSTTSARSFLSFPSTAAASFTIASLYHYEALQGTFGAGSAVTSQYGFFANSNLTGATNNYGFFSDIASGSNRWNFYAAGTARNYFAGGVEDAAGNLRDIPSAGTAKTSAYTLTITDVGEFVTVGTSGSITVPNDTFTAGNAISIYNDTTGNITINCPITTAYLAGTNTDRASLTLATRGIATILFINPSLCVASGNLT